MTDDVLKVAITSIVTLIGSWLVFRGGRFTAQASKEASENTAKVDAQQSALEAWQELLTPYRDEVHRVNLRLDAAFAEIDAQRRTVDQLRSEVTHWQRLAKVIARWATTLRDQVISLGGTVPATPDELLVIQALDDTTADPSL